jgi:hypothetical protein
MVYFDKLKLPNWKIRSSFNIIHLQSQKTKIFIIISTAPDAVHRSLNNNGKCVFKHRMNGVAFQKIILH